MKKYLVFKKIVLSLRYQTMKQMYSIKEINKATKELNFTQEESNKVAEYIECYECSMLEAIELILEVR